MYCYNCGRSPSEIYEYVYEANIKGITPDDVAMSDKTYNEVDNTFCCPECYMSTNNFVDENEEYGNQ